MNKRFLKIEIHFNISLFDDSYVAAVNDIKKIKNKDGTIDQEALTRYLDFIENVEQLFLKYDMVLLNSREDQKSKLSLTSRYYDFYKNTDISEIFIKLIAFLRISDHVSPEYWKEKHKDKAKNRAEEYKRPETKKKQKYMKLEIIVNKDTFESYDAALKRVEELLQKVEKRS